MREPGGIKCVEAPNAAEASRTDGLSDDALLEFFGACRVAAEKHTDHVFVFLHSASALERKGLVRLSP